MGMKAPVTDTANAPLFCPETEPLLQLKVYPRQANFSLLILAAFPHVNQGSSSKLWETFAPHRPPSPTTLSLGKFSILADLSEQLFQWGM